MMGSEVDMRGRFGDGNGTGMGIGRQDITAPKSTALVHTHVTTANVQFALAAVGRTEAILDYNRIRSGESRCVVVAWRD
jgi:hypothetical protein